MPDAESSRARQYGEPFSNCSRHARDPPNNSTEESTNRGVTRETRVSSSGRNRLNFPAAHSMCQCPVRPSASKRTTCPASGMKRNDRAPANQAFKPETKSPEAPNSATEISASTARNRTGSGDTPSKSGAKTNASGRASNRSISIASRSQANSSAPASMNFRCAS